MRRTLYALEARKLARFEWETCQKFDSVVWVTHDDVARRAFEIWQARGGGGDSPDGDWYRAEQELLAELGRAEALNQVDAQNSLAGQLNQRTQALVGHTIARLRFWNSLGILYIKEKGQWQEQTDAMHRHAGHHEQPFVHTVAEQAAARALFMQKLEVDEEIAGILVAEGFSTVEEIAYVPVGELLAVEGFDEDIVEELRSRARDALLNEALAVEEGLEEHQPAEDLLELPGMDEATAYALAERGVRTREELAEMATDEIADIEDVGEERAAALIMEARKHWFE